MPVILPVKDKQPQFGNNCFIAPNATIVGDVVMGDDCSAWFNTVIRGDVNFIRMGKKVNVQDGACIHCTYLKYGTTIGDNVSIGHHAIVHGCTIHDNVLIGMGAIVMERAMAPIDKPPCSACGDEMELSLLIPPVGGPYGLKVFTCPRCGRSKDYLIGRPEAA